MTIGKELDQAFYNLGQRITRLEKKEVEYPIKNDPTERIAELVDHEISERVNGDLERIEAELNDRIDEVEKDMGFDPDDLRCDLESRIEEVADNWSYIDDRVDDIECYKITEDEARDIALDVVRDEIGDAISETVTEAVCDEVNSRAVGFTEWSMLVDRVKELEDRLNKPTLGARVLRWLREGPSAKELATKWYASLRRARV